MEYTLYAVEDFVRDEYFQKWILNADSMTSNFWNNWMAEHPEKKATVEDAKKFILLMDFDNDKLSNADFDAMWQRIIENRNTEQITSSVVPKRKTRTLYWKYAVAASVLLIVALTIFLNKQSNEQQFTKPVIVNNQIETGTDKATLTLETGKKVTLAKGTSFQTQNITINGKRIVYSTKDRYNNHIVYNTLTVPRGGQFQMILSDGTKVWLNSESQLKYPVRFIEGKIRQVELVYGEAYFEVSPSTSHNGVKFRVFNNAQVVEVSGTAFNIKAYKEESNVYTTLVEGKVAVITLNGKEVLEPNQQSNVNLSNHSITVSTTNVYNEISWKEGVFSFDDKSLKKIMTVLSRWYNMEVEFANNEVADEEFIGVLGRTQTIEEILSNIKSFGIIKNYEINDRKVILK